MNAPSSGLERVAIGDVREGSGPHVSLSRVLEKGTYLLELALARPAPSAGLTRALERAGFASPLVDESLVGTEGFGPETARIFASGPPALLRFVARIERPLARLEGPEIAWLYARRIGIDVYAPIAEEPALVPHELDHGALYETRLVARMRAQGKRSVVEHALAVMGFGIVKLSSLQKDVRLPGRPGASDALWYALLRWQGRKNVLTIEDPFFFHDFVRIESVESL